MDEQWDINMRSGIEEELWIFPSMRFAMRIFQRSKTQLMRWKTHLSSVQTSMVNLEHLFVAVSWTSVSSKQKTVNRGIARLKNSDVEANLSCWSLACLPQQKRLHRGVHCGTNFVMIDGSEHFSFVIKQKTNLINLWSNQKNTPLLKGDALIWMSRSKHTVWWLYFEVVWGPTKVASNG